MMMVLLALSSERLLLVLISWSGSRTDLTAFPSVARQAQAFVRVCALHTGGSIDTRVGVAHIYLCNKGGRVTLLFSAWGRGGGGWSCDRKTVTPQDSDVSEQYWICCNLRFRFHWLHTESSGFICSSHQLRCFKIIHLVKKCYICSQFEFESVSSCSRISVFSIGQEQQWWKGHLFPSRRAKERRRRTDTANQKTTHRLKTDVVTCVTRRLCDLRAELTRVWQAPQTFNKPQKHRDP